MYRDESKAVKIYVVSGEGRKRENLRSRVKL